MLQTQSRAPSILGFLSFHTTLRDCLNSTSLKKTVDDKNNRLISRKESGGVIRNTSEWKAHTMAEMNFVQI